MKISYKTYQNDRLKLVDFHGTLVYPLYVQVTYFNKDGRFISGKNWPLELGYNKEPLVWFCSSNISNLL